MKIGEVIARVDELRRNDIDKKEKVRWLSRLDWKVKHKLIDTHQGAAQVDFAGYNEHTSMDTDLLVPEPYDEMYEHYLIAQIEYAHQQEDRYNNAIDLFDQVWDEFAKWYIHTHKPIPIKLKF